MFSIIHELYLDFKDKGLVYNLYKNQNAEITIYNESASSKICRSVRQECLKNCYVEKIIKEIKEKLRSTEMGIKGNSALIILI